MECTLVKAVAYNPIGNYGGFAANCKFGCSTVWIQKENSAFSGLGFTIHFMCVVAA